jgi:hypothetical protein
VISDFDQPRAGADVGIGIEIRYLHGENEANMAGQSAENSFSPPKRPGFAKSMF